MNQLPDFDELMNLAKNDPAALEKFRQDSCLAFIESTPSTHQHRLRTLQFRLEGEIRNARTPMAGVLKLSNMMHDSFYELTETINLLRASVLAATHRPHHAASTLPRGNGPAAGQASKVTSITDWRQRHPKDISTPKKNAKQPCKPPQSD